MSLIENFDELPVCCDCKGKIEYGAAFRMTCSDGKSVWVETRCRHCADKYAGDFWPDDWGPNPYVRPRSTERRQ